MKTIIATHKKYGNKEVLVDDEDYEKLSEFRWYLMKSTYTYYAMSNIKVAHGLFETFFMHRYLCDSMDHVDHKDGNGLNNQKNNLRPATNSQNQCNRLNRKLGKFGYKGITYKKTHKKFAAYVTVNNKPVFGGHFNTAREAAIGYNIIAKKYHGDFAILNEICA